MLDWTHPDDMGYGLAAGAGLAVRERYSHSLTPHPTPYTLHPLHPTPDTIHNIPYTRHLTPCPIKLAAHRAGGAGVDVRLTIHHTVNRERRNACFLKLMSSEYGDVRKAWPDT